MARPRKVQVALPTGPAAELALILARNLTRIRTAAGFTHEALAARAEISSQSIGRMERGQLGTSLATVAVVAQALKCPPAVLITSERDQ